MARPTPRKSQLAGRHPAAPQVSPIQAAPEPGSNPVATVPTSATTEVSPLPGARTQRPQTADSREARTKATAFYISTDLWDDFDRVRKQRNFDNGQLIIIAIEKTYKDRSLHHEIERSRVEVGGDLFTKLANTRPPRKGVRRLEAKLLHPDHFTTLDRLVTELGAQDRSRLVDAALRLYLPKTRGESDDH